MKIKYFLILLSISIIACNQQAMAMNSMILPEEKTTADYTYEFQVSQPQPVQKQTGVKPDQIQDFVDPTTLIRTITKISQTIENGKIITTTKTWVSKKPFVKTTNIADQKPTQKGDEDQKDLSDQPNNAAGKKAEESSIWANENLLYGAGIAAGAVLAGGTYALVNYLEQQKRVTENNALAKKHTDRQNNESIARSNERFEYLNYLDDRARDDSSNSGKKLIEEKKQERRQRALNQRSQRDSSARSLPEIAIEDVEIEQFDYQGYPTIDAIKKLMTERFFNRYKEIGVSIVNGGASNEKIYCVSVDKKPVFFLKISKDATVSQRLIAIQQGKIGRLGIEKKLNAANPISKKNLPFITWLEKILKYNSPTSQKLIEISHPAHGKSVSQIFLGNNENETELCLKAVGTSLASFQQFFIKYNNSDKFEDWRTVKSSSKCNTL